MAEHDGLLELAQEGKRAGAEGLFHAFATRLFTFARHAVGDPHSASDITIEAFKGVFREIVTFTSASGVLIRLYAIAFREVLTRAQAGDPVDPGWHDVDDPEATGADEDKLLAALKEVAVRERAMWLLRLDGLSEVEVAFAAGLDVKSSDVGAKVNDGIALAKRQFLAGLSTTPAPDGGKASETADQLGLMLRRRPMPPQMWATIDRTLRAERILIDDAAPPKRRGGARSFPWWTVAVIAVIGFLVWAGITGKPASEPTRELQIVVGVRDGEAGVWLVRGGEAWVAWEGLDATEPDVAFMGRLRQWRESYQSPRLNRREFNASGSSIAERLRVKFGGLHVEFRPIDEAE